MLCEYTKKLCGENVEIKAQPIKSKVPAVLLLDEFARRMDEAQKYYGMPNMGGALKYTLVLNTESSLIGAINKMNDDEKKENAVKYVYDLARLQHGSLSPEDVAAFVENSAKLLEETV
jgi:molecular chaperone HtpG